MRCRTLLFISYIIVIANLLFIDCYTGSYVLVDDAIVEIESVPPKPPEPALYHRNMFRALSLRQLQVNYMNCIQTNSCADSIGFIGGLNTVEGFIIDKSKNDIILLGRNDSTLPSITIDDLIVIFRCAFKTYVKDNVFTPPGCSIDPIPETMKKLSQIIAQALQR